MVPARLWIPLSEDLGHPAGLDLEVVSPEVPSSLTRTQIPVSRTYLDGISLNGDLSRSCRAWSYRSHGMLQRLRDRILAAMAEQA